MIILLHQGAHLGFGFTIAKGIRYKPLSDDSDYDRCYANFPSEAILVQL
jgi:hypothetical protein